jgi:hypothetical protein
MNAESEAVVQRQLDAYNARDVAALVGSSQERGSSIGDVLHCQVRSRIQNSKPPLAYCG